MHISYVIVTPTDTVLLPVKHLTDLKPGLDNGLRHRSGRANLAPCLSM